MRVTGCPGKSYVIARVQQLLARQGKSFALTAPTGAAAINIGGETLNSLAGCAVPSTVTDFSKMWRNKLKWRELDALIIDEVRCECYGFQ
jgi:hypothetical protein